MKGERIVEDVYLDDHGCCTIQHSHGQAVHVTDLKVNHGDLLYVFTQSRGPGELTLGVRHRHDLSPAAGCAVRIDLTVWPLP